MGKRRTKRLRELNDISLALQRLPRSATAGRARRGLLERLERWATDAPIQSLRYRLAAWRLERVAEGDEDHDKAGERLVRAESARMFSRPLTPQARGTLEWLESHGLTRRELRIAVFSKFITKDGQIRINWVKERILQIGSLSITMLCLVGWLDLVFRLNAAALSLGVQIWIAGAIFAIFDAILLPIVVLGMLPIRVAKRIRAIQEEL